jgi:hypothetical protein
LQVPNFALILATKKTTSKDKVGMDLTSSGFCCSAEPIRYSSVNNFVQAFKDCGFKQENMIPAYGLAEHVLVVSIVACDEDRVVRRAWIFDTQMGEGEAYKI